MKKKFLTTADLSYDSSKKCWQLPLKPAYHWKDFFRSIRTIDFSTGSIEYLQEIMPSITYSIIANIPLLCLPKTHGFFPLQAADVIKIDDLFLTLAENETITLNGLKTILIESTCIEPTLIIDEIDQFRMISIKPGDALHFIKKLKSNRYIDLPAAFWQAQYQWYDKTFILDECQFPYSEEILKNHLDDSLKLKDLLTEENELILKNLIISQQKSHYIRLFFTIKETAFMLIAHKPGYAEHEEQTTIQEIVQLSDEARDQYKVHYLSLKNSLTGSELIQEQ